MEVTWKEYCNAKEVVAKFEKHREDVRRSRRPFNWDYLTLSNMIWRKRYELSKEMYLIRNATSDVIERVGKDFLDEQIKNLQNELLKLRLHARANVL